MKKVIKGSLLVITMLVFMVGSALAAKPQDVIEMSNGFPSGMHFNLNIHGKDWHTCNAVQEPDDDSWGNSIFVPEYGAATIQYVSNKKASIRELTVLDPCGGFDGPNDVAKIQLPHKVEVDGDVITAEGYYVFGRILGKPNNSSNDGDPSSIILYPNVVVQACNDDPDAPDPNFGDDTSCDELALGLIVGTNLYIAEPEEYVRFNPGATKGKGKSKATDITRLFTYTGWVVDEGLDINGPDGVPDGVIDEYDVPLDAYDYVPDLDEDGDISVEEWLKFQEQQDPQMAWYFAKEWIFNIADLVVTEQGLVNDGTKLLQIRFYPVATTEFTPPPE